MVRRKVDKERVPGLRDALSISWASASRYPQLSDRAHEIPPDQGEPSPPARFEIFINWNREGDARSPFCSSTLCVNALLRVTDVFAKRKM